MQPKIDAVETGEMAKIEVALRLVDGGLVALVHRELVSTSEVSDLLLDLRSVLDPQPQEPEAVSAAQQ